MFSLWKLGDAYQLAPGLGTTALGNPAVDPGPQVLQLDGLFVCVLSAYLGGHLAPGAHFLEPIWFQGPKSWIRIRVTSAVRLIGSLLI